MKEIKTTRHGNVYYRLNDGRIGMITNEYARVTVAREGLRDGEFFREDSKMTDRFYQINFRDKDGNRIRHSSRGESYLRLVGFEDKNCSEMAMLKRERDMYKSHLQGKIRQVQRLERTPYLENEDHWNDGFHTAKQEMKEQVEYYMNKILNTI